MILALCLRGSLQCSKIKMILAEKKWCLVFQRMTSALLFRWVNVLLQMTGRYGKPSTRTGPVLLASISPPPSCLLKKKKIPAENIWPNFPSKMKAKRWFAMYPTCLCIVMRDSIAKTLCIHSVAFPHPPKGKSISSKQSKFSITTILPLFCFVLLFCTNSWARFFSKGLPLPTPQETFWKNHATLKWLLSCSPGEVVVAWESSVFILKRSSWRPKEHVSFLLPVMVQEESSGRRVNEQRGNPGTLNVYKKSGNWFGGGGAFVSKPLCCGDGL